MERPYPALHVEGFEPKRLHRSVKAPPVTVTGAHLREYRLSEPSLPIGPLDHLGRGIGIGNPSDPVGLRYGEPAIQESNVYYVSSNGKPILASTGISAIGTK